MTEEQFRDLRDLLDKIDCDGFPEDYADELFGYIELLLAEVTRLRNTPYNYEQRIRAIIREENNKALHIAFGDCFGPIDAIHGYEARNRLLAQA